MMMELNIHLRFKKIQADISDDIRLFYVNLHFKSFNDKRAIDDNQCTN